MAAVVEGFLREQLYERRQRLQRAASAEAGDSARLHLLLAEVDGALARFDNGSYGVCETCHDSIESDRLICDPLVRFCLDQPDQARKERARGGSGTRGSRAAGTIAKPEPGELRLANLLSPPASHADTLAG